MAQPITVAQAEYEAKRKTTYRGLFLGEMEHMALWTALLSVLELCHFSNAA